jgi:GNAT superfamily N-acetyltransferase
MSSPISVRQAEKGDSATILRLLRQLARFEGAPDGVRLTEEAIRRDAFGERPRFEALLAEADNHACGLLIFFLAYSSWSGAPTLMVHDLFVEADFRRSGAGRALLAAVARLSESRGCCRMDVNVLAWNESARRFYAALGFVPLENWMPYRLERDGVERLAGATANIS